MEYLSIFVRTAQSYLDCWIRAAEQSFNQAMESINFPIFCLIYSIVLIWILRKCNEEAIFRPKNKQLIDWKTSLKLKISTFLVNLPIVRGIVAKKFKVQMQKMKVDISKQLQHGRDLKKSTKLPTTGMNSQNLTKRITTWFETEEKALLSGKISGAIYTDDRDHFNKLNDFAEKYMYQNPLHLDTYKQLMRMEAQILNMTGNLVSKLGQFHGVITSGGTQSLLMAVYAYRQYYSNRTKPNIVVPVSIHAAVDKACFYFNVEIRKAKLNSKYEADVKHMQSLIDENTILLIGSYPNYPHGIIDPIRQIALLAKKNNAGMHIDGCLGGFIAAFSKDHQETFSLDLEGVTSVSLDQHKFGLAPKGISTVFFKTKQLRHSMYYMNTDWVGGIYASPSYPGSRSGFASAGAWYSLTHVTRKGFNENAKEVIDATKSVVIQLRKINQIEVLGEPILCVLAFTTKNTTVSVFDLAAYMNKEKGWTISPVHLPNAIHISVTLSNCNSVKYQLAKDIAASIQYLAKNPPKQSSTAALYGASSSLPSDDMGEEMIKTLLSSTLR